MHDVIQREGERATTVRSPRSLVGRADRYGRTLARIEVEGQDVNAAMIEAGMAWHYTRYSKAADLTAAERAARAGAAVGVAGERKAAVGRCHPEQKRGCDDA